MRQLRRVIRPGSKLLNWSSLGISDFVQKSGAVSRREITITSRIIYIFFFYEDFMSCFNSIFYYNVKLFLISLLFAVFFKIHCKMDL